MKKFVANELGGTDVYGADGEILVRLDAEELRAIYEIQQNNYDIQNVRDRIPDWVMEQLENDDFFFEDFNSHLCCGDEISEQEIYQKILSDDSLIRKIADEYRELENYGYSEDGGFDWWKAQDKAIGKNVSIKDIMGEILREKNPKELLVGQWRILLIEQGDLYGHVKRVPWQDNEPCVEFYDMYANKEQYPNGQFTTGRFYVDQLVHPGMFTPSLEQISENGDSWMLHPNKEEWTVGAGDLAVIGAWLKAVHAHAVPSIEQRLSEAHAQTDRSSGAQGERAKGQGERDCISKS